MEQLLLHLVGDYILQTDWMANNKANRSLPAAVHALVYSLPFLLLSPSLAALAVIMTTHFFIDRYRLARYVVFAKNWVTNPRLRLDDCAWHGYPNYTPVWLAGWLFIITDNTCHLVLNYAALRWL